MAMERETEVKKWGVGGPEGEERRGGMVSKR